MNAEKVGHYWKTSKTSPNAKLDQAEALIERHSGEVLFHGRGTMEGREAYVMEFQFGGDRFRVVWPVLDTKRPQDREAARRQATTFLFHSVKAKLVDAKVLGVEEAPFVQVNPDARVEKLVVV